MTRIRGILERIPQELKDDCIVDVDAYMEEATMGTILMFKHRLMVAFRAIEDMGGDLEVRTAQVLQYLTIKEAERLLALLEKVADKWEKQHETP